MLAGAQLPASENLTQVMPAVLTAIGEPHESTLSFPQASRACVVMVDGLDFHNLDVRRGHAPTLRALGIDRAITTVVPSTTAAGISSFGTGRWPGQTAMGGYALRVPGSAEVFNLIAWNSPALSPESWQTQPTFFETSTRDLVKIQPRKFVGSGLTRAGLRGARTVVAERLEARVDATLAELRAGADLAYLYWGDIDSTGHHSGWESEAWIAQLEHFDAELGRLRRMLPSDTLLVVTADHGMVDVAERIDIADNQLLTRGIDVVAGESRAVHLYTDAAATVATRWREVLGDQAWVLTRDEAVEAGLFGSMTPHAHEVFGDVIAFAKGQTVIVDSRYQSADAIGLIGVHGSLTAEEMMIPLIVDLA